MFKPKTPRACRGIGERHAGVEVTHVQTKQMRDLVTGFSIPWRPDGERRWLAGRIVGMIISSLRAVVLMGAEKLMRLYLSFSRP